jgi:hypothetical protein
MRPPANPSQELECEIFNLNHSGNEDQVDQGPNQEEPSGAKPDNSGDPATQVEAVQSQNAKSAKEPQEICHKKIFHWQYVGRRVVVISVTVDLKV